jgi:c-di-GMP-binding flagellar brake protein YcgR
MPAPRFSQITIPDTGVVLVGRLATINAGGITVTMESLPVNMDALNPGRMTDVVLNMAHGEYQTRTSVVSFEQSSNNLLLSFSETIQPVQRRGSYRLAIALPVTIRAMYDDGRIEPWQETVTKDLSAGGIKVAISGCVSVPQRIDIRLRMPDDRNPLLAACRVAHSRQLAAGRFEVGLAFRKLSNADSVKLIQFVEETASKLEAETAKNEE